MNILKQQNIKLWWIKGVIISKNCFKSIQTRRSLSRGRIRNNFWQKCTKFHLKIATIRYRGNWIKICHKIRKPCASNPLWNALKTVFLTLQGSKIFATCCCANNVLTVCGRFKFKRIRNYNRIVGLCWEWC